MERTQPLRPVPIAITLSAFTRKRRLELNLAVAQPPELGGCLFNMGRMIGAKFGELLLECVDRAQVSLLDSGECIGLNLKRVRKSLNLLFEAHRRRAELGRLGLCNPKIGRQLVLDLFRFNTLSFQTSTRIGLSLHSAGKSLDLLLKTGRGVSKPQDFSSQILSGAFGRS